MTQRLSGVANVVGRAYRGLGILSAALLAGCLFTHGTGGAAEANAEADCIVETVTRWLEPYQPSNGVTTEREGDSIYVCGRLGVLPSVFSAFDFTFLVDAAAREVVCFAYLPTIVPEERRREMTEFIFRGEWEYGISTASLVLEDDGRVRCQAWSPFESFALQPRETRWRLLGAVVDKLWSFAEGVAAVTLGADPAVAASDVKRSAAFEGRDEAAFLEDAADADTKTVIERCFGKDAEIENEEADDAWLNRLSGHGGEVSVGMIRARFEDVVRDIGGAYDLLPYALIVREGMVWNVCTVPEECPKEMRGEASELLMTMNQGLKYALFSLDFDTGKIWCQYALPVAVIPDGGTDAPRNLYGVLIKTQSVIGVSKNSQALHAAMVAALPERESDRAETGCRQNER